MHPNFDDIYVVYYDRSRLMKLYGPTQEEIERAVDAAPTPEAAVAAQRALFDEPVIQYLGSIDKIPSECVDGVTIISHQGYLHRLSTAAFECKRDTVINP